MLHVNYFISLHFSAFNGAFSVCKPIKLKPAIYKCFIVSDAAILLIWNSVKRGLL
jgi:hypothetical protein